MGADPNSVHLLTPARPELVAKRRVTKRTVTKRTVTKRRVTKRRVRSPVLHLQNKSL